MLSRAESRASYFALTTETQLAAHLFADRLLLCLAKAEFANNISATRGHFIESIDGYSAN